MLYFILVTGTMLGLYLTLSILFNILSDAIFDDSFNDVNLNLKENEEEV